MEKNWNDKELLNDNNNKGMHDFYSGLMQFNALSVSSAEFTLMNDAVNGLGFKDPAAAMVAGSYYANYKLGGGRSRKRWSEDEDRVLRAASISIMTKSEFLRKQRQGIRVDENDLRTLGELAKKLDVKLDDIKDVEQRILKVLELEMEEIKGVYFAKRNVFLIVGYEQFGYKQGQKPISRKDLREKANDILDKVVKQGFDFGGIYKEAALRAVVIAFEKLGGRVDKQKLYHRAGVNSEHFETNLKLWRDLYRV